MHNYFLTVIPPGKANGGRNGGKTSANRAMTGSCFNVKLSVVINNAFIGARIESNLLAYLCYLS